MAAFRLHGKRNSEGDVSETTKSSPSNDLQISNDRPSEAGLGLNTGSWLGKGHTLQTFGIHVALLSDTRIHHPSNRYAKHRIMSKLQGEFGNKYVQRVVESASQSKLEKTQRRIVEVPTNGKAAGSGPKTQRGADLPAIAVVERSEKRIHRDFWSSVSRGADIYFNGVDDEGGSFARELIRWRVIGFGQDFNINLARSDWTRFMTDRPEIQRAMAEKFEEIALSLAASGPGTGNISEDMSNVRLDELESMRLTLHGCHKIEIRGRYEVTEESGTMVVTLSGMTFTWIDRADLHPGTITELDSGEEVDDSEFTDAGWDYDISILFAMPRSSTWHVTSGSASHIRGWPPITGAPAAGFRG